VQAGRANRNAAHVSLAGNEKVAKIEVFVEARAYVQLASQAGHLLMTERFHFSKSGAGSLSAASDSLVQRQHPAQFFDSEKTAQLSPRTDILRRRHRGGHRQAVL